MLGVFVSESLLTMSIVFRRSSSHGNKRHSRIRIAQKLQVIGAKKLSAVNSTSRTIYSRMYGGRNRATKLAAKPAQRIWICQRCFHAQTKLLSEQHSNTSSDPSKQPEKPLSPVEAFRLKYLQPQTQNEPPKQPLSPAERFRTSWSKATADQPPSQPVPEKTLTLNDLAIEYRKHGSPRQYCSEILIGSNEKEEVDDIPSEEPRRMLESNDVNELSRLDEMEEVTENAEIFAGENMRDYQGVLPLNGEHYTPTKFPIKQGDLI